MEPGRAPGLAAVARDRRCRRLSRVQRALHARRRRRVSQGGRERDGRLSAPSLRCARAVRRRGVRRHPPGYLGGWRMRGRGATTPRGRGARAAPRGLAVRQGRHDQRRRRDARVGRRSAGGGARARGRRCVVQGQGRRAQLLARGCQLARACGGQSPTVAGVPDRLRRPLPRAPHSPVPREPPDRDRSAARSGLGR